MLHGYEEASIIPAIDLFDSGIMQQMVAAAREQYNQSQTNLDNFYKTYGDFLSPSAKDTQYYYDNTIKHVADALNYAYANGIDLTRSAEGRAFIANITRNVPYAKLAAMKQNAKDLDTYNKLVAQAKANGTYVSDEAQAFLNGGFNPNDFSTVDENGDIVMVGNRTPYRIRSMNEATADFYKGRTPHELTKKQVEAMGGKYDPRYKYVGFDYNDLVKTAGSQTQGWVSTPEGKWYHELARRKVAAAGGDPNDEALVQAQLNDDVAQANIRFEVQPTSQKDDYAYLDAQTKASNYLDAQKQARSLAVQRQLLADQAAYNNATQTQPVSYSTLVNQGSASNANRNGNGIDVSNAAKGLDGMLNRIIPNRTNEEKAKFQTNFNKLSKDRQAQYGRIKTIYNKVMELQSSNEKTRNAAWEWFQKRPNAFKYAFVPRGASGQELTKSVNNIFGQFEYTLEGGLAQTANRILGKGVAMKSPWKGKYQKVDLSKGSSIRFSPIVKANALGGSLYKFSSDERKFDRLLQGIKEGWLVDNAKTSATIGNKVYTSGVATIPYKKLFEGSKADGNGLATFKRGDTTWTISKLKKLGVTVMTSSGDPLTDEAFYKLSRNEQNNVVIKVPVTKTNNVDDMAVWQDADSYYMSVIGGKGLSKEQLVNNQARALQVAAEIQ